MSEDAPLRQEIAEELRRRGVDLVYAPGTARATLHRGADQVLVDLDAMVRAARDRGGLGAVPGVVRAVLEGPAGLPGWLVARSGVRLSLESLHHEFRDTLHAPLTRGTTRVLVYADPEERFVTWISGRTLEGWGLEPEDVHWAARSNMASLLDGTHVEVHRMRGRRCAVFQIDSVFKASLLLAPNLRERVAPLLGWPVVAIAPCRDFLMAFEDGDPAWLPGLADVVMHEHAGSGHPVTTEVLRCSDEGISALGAFGEAPPEPDDAGP
ncbi:hypothetical protein L6R50_12435 [Myxococcota bacterium]|nr:hypothetical protein [Myxococcota bacterium]